MKVCMIASTYPRFPGDGGAGRSIQSIAEALVSLGHEIHVLAPYHPKIVPFKSPVRLHHFRYVWPNALTLMGYSGALHNDQRLHPLAYLLVFPYLFFGILALLLLQRRYHFDVLHVHWVIPNGVIGAVVSCLQRIPLVISLHGSDVFVAQQGALFGAVARWVFSHAQAITACSPELLQGALMLGAPGTRTYPIVWGADPAVFDKVYDLRDLRTKWGIGPDDPVVLSLGRLVRKKGLEDLMRAIPLILSQNRAVRFVIGGDGPERERLAALASALKVDDHVIFAGIINWKQVPQYLQLCDVFVVPSVRDEAGNADGLPATVLESMAAGKPVVATRIGGIPWAVMHEETGLLINEHQPGQLAEAVLCLLTDPARRLAYGRASRKRVETELNWDKVAEIFADLYQKERPVRHAM